MHEHLSVDLKYGCGKYDYQSGGTVICVAPGQIGGKEDNGERMELDGWALLFHPDMLHYFGDMIKKHTGDSAKSYIHQFIIQQAKSLLASGETIAAASYDLGFEYPQHLSRLFKEKEGISPSEYIFIFPKDYRIETNLRSDGESHVHYYP